MKEPIDIFNYISFGAFLFTAVLATVALWCAHFSFWIGLMLWFAGGFSIPLVVIAAFIMIGIDIPDLIKLFLRKHFARK